MRFLLRWQGGCINTHAWICSTSVHVCALACNAALFSHIVTLPFPEPISYGPGWILNVCSTRQFFCISSIEMNGSSPGTCFQSSGAHTRENAQTDCAWVPHPPVWHHHLLLFSLCSPVPFLFPPPHSFSNCYGSLSSFHAESKDFNFLTFDFGASGLVSFSSESPTFPPPPTCNGSFSNSSVLISSLTCAKPKDGLLLC